MNIDGISFIIPAYNEEKSISETINSIKNSAVELDIKYEIIVCDNDSTDKTIEISSNLGAKIAQTKIRNISVVRNTGAKDAKYSLLCFVDADSLVSEKLIKKSIQRIDKGFFVISCLSHFKNYPTFESFGVWFYNLFSKIFKLGVGQYIFVRKKIFNEIGGFPESYFAFEDLYLIKNIKKKYGWNKAHILSEVVRTSPRKFDGTKSVKKFLLLLITAVLTSNVGKDKSKLDFWYERNQSERRTNYKIYLIYIVAFMLTFESLKTFGINSDLIESSRPIATTLIFLLLAIVSLDKISFFLFFALITYLIEVIGIKTGFPFGSYKYDEAYSAIGILGVPVYIAFAWFIIISWVSRIFTNPFKVFSFVILIDIVIETFAMHQNLWIWNNGSILVAPIQNFISWGIIGILGMYLSKFFRNKPPILFSMIPMAFIMWNMTFSVIPYSLQISILGFALVFSILICSLAIAIKETEDYHSVPFKN